MAEADPLKSIGLIPDSLWGDDNETIVYAQAIWKGKPFIFRFHLDPNTPPQALSARIVNFYNGNEDPAAPCGFQDRSALRRTIWATIASVWPSIAATISPSTGTVIDIREEGGVATGRPYHDPLFGEYLDLFRGVRLEDLIPFGDLDHTPVMDLSKVTIVSVLGGKGCSKKVRIDGSQCESSTMVFKGIDFATYLLLHDDDDQAIRAAVDAWKNESRLIASTPPHPHIQSPPKVLITAQGANGGEPVFVGHLSQFLAKGDLAAVIEEANASKTQIPLRQKKKWCLHMAKALEHTHHAMHTYHMDVKPGNFLVDDQDNLRLIDWEQSGAPPTTLAPEADGTWDVHEVDGFEGGGTFPPRLVYTKYTGPERRNMPEGCGQQPFHIWNVFPVWQASCPRATELAETFALGRTMWMLLTQTVGDFDDVEQPNDVKIAWPNTDELPSTWIDNVMRCMEKDPNDRPGLADIVNFWDVEQTKTTIPVDM